LKSLPYTILTISMYGKFDWINRDSLGVVRIPVPRLATHLRTRAHRLEAALAQLDKWGLIRGYRWYGTYFQIDLLPPIGMAIYVDVPEVIVNEGPSEG
jgi:hypothetical protein